MTSTAQPTPVASTARTLKVLTALTAVVQLVHVLLDPGALGSLSALSAEGGEEHKVAIFLGIAIGFGISIILPTAWVWFLVRKVERRKNWARITLLILTLVGLAVLVPSWLRAFPSAPLATLINAVINLFSLLATLSLFSGTANAWFKNAEESRDE